MTENLNEEPERPGGEMLPGVARAQVEGKLIGGVCPEVVPRGYLAQQRGVFVTIWHEEKGLRGCKGTIHAAKANLVEETRYNAMAAAFQDWRCPPVTGDELNALAFEVSVLGELEDVSGEDELDPAAFGVVVAAEDGRRGLLLPQVRGIETVKVQLSTARKKAGIGGDEPARIMRFRIDKFSEER